MVIIFRTNGNVDEYVNGGRGYRFPEAPTMKCRKCKRFLKFKKHGFRKRWYSSKLYIGIIIIRRYICPCKRFTLSMMPDFCLKSFTTSFEHIFGYIFRIIIGNKKQKEILEELNLQEAPLNISRQRAYFYRKRFLRNLKFIEIGLRTINSELELPSKELSHKERARGIMEIVKTEFTTLNKFSQIFHQAINNSPIALIKL